MSEINWINFKGLDSRDFNLLIRTKDTYKRAERDISFISVPGRSGDIVIDDGKYPNVEIEYGMRLISTQYPELSENENFFYSFEDVNRWLVSDGNYYSLIDSYDNMYYRKACLIKGLEVEQPHHSIGDFSIKFNCKPFRYRLDGDEIITVTQKGTGIYNTEMYPSLPYMKITGNGDIWLHIGGRQYNFYDVSGYVECDSEAMNVYKNLISKNNYYQGTEFPTLQPGENVISWAGNVSKIEIKPRWRTI